MRRLLLLCLSFITGCTLLVSNPEVTVKDVNVVSLDPSGMAIELYLAVMNPNSFDVTLSGYSYDLNVSALPLARGGARDQVLFRANTSTEMRLPVRVTYNDMLEILKRQPDPDRIPYCLQAGFDLDTPVGAIVVPFEKNGNYAVPEKYRPSYYLQKISDALGELKK